jgi:hypothetical protein
MQRRAVAFGVAFGVGMVLACAVAAPVRAGDEHQYVGAKKCKSCHGKELMGDQHAVWLENPHHRAYETLLSEESRAIARERGLAEPPHESAACLSCHVTAYGLPPERFKYELHAEDGVQCESCHGPGQDYRKKKIMSERERAEARGLWDPGGDAAICTECHNERSPTFDPKRYTLPDGTTAAFDFDRAKARIDHPIPPDVKGHYVELDEERREARRAARGY